MYIVLEGIDTAGKSTQIKSLKKYFKEAIFTFEPGATPLGKEIREMLLHTDSISKEAEMLLFLADRAEHSQKVLLPNKDKLIISDRSLISGIAYAKDFDFKLLGQFNIFATNGILPNKVILLELDKDTLQMRLNNKGLDAIESRGVPYLLELQMRLKEAILRLELDVIFIDASLDEACITQKIIDFIQCAV